MKAIFLSIIGKVIVATIVLTTLAIITRAQNKKTRPEKKRR